MKADGTTLGARDEGAPKLVDAAGHPLAEGTLPDGTPIWVHTGAAIRDCPVVEVLRELGNLPRGDDFRIPWTERARELVFEGESSRG